MTPTDPWEETIAAVLAAALPHVAFDGWSDAVLARAGEDAGLDRLEVKRAFPKGAVDLALAFHSAGDRALVAALADEDLEGLRYSEKVARAVMLRLEIADEHREAVRRGAALFALPLHAASGARAIWQTADTIWTALGDTSDDLNWYSKRAILSGVYSSSLLYWLGDESEGSLATQAFVDRRIADVMWFEKTKAKAQSSRMYEAFRRGPGRILDRVTAPKPTDDLPGRWAR